MITVTFQCHSAADEEELLDRLSGGARFYGVDVTVKQVVVTRKSEPAPKEDGPGWYLPRLSSSP